MNTEAPDHVYLIPDTRYVGSPYTVVGNFTDDDAVGYVREDLAKPTVPVFSDLTEAQLQTLNDPGLNLHAILTTSGSRWLVGTSPHPSGPGVFLHCDEAAEPIYMTMTEAQLLALSLLALVEDYQ